MKNKKIRLRATAALCLMATILSGGCGGGKDMSGDSISKEETSSAEKICAAKVIVISGQSNASGFTWSKCLKNNVSEEAYRKYEEGFGNAMIYYNVDTAEENGYSWKDGGDNTSGGEFVNVKLGQGHTAERFGMEIGIAEKLAEIKPDEKLYLIKCAWGSASLFNDFASPSMKNYPTSVYYDKFISVVKAGISKLEELTDLPVEIKALCWMQGEKDAAYYSEASQYGPNLQTFAGDFRSEFSAYKGRGEIAFIDAEISEGEYCAYGEYVNQHKAWFAEKSDDNYLLSTQGFSYGKEPEEKPDPYHFDSLSMLRLGYRFAEVIAKLL
jgi:lipoprotein